MRAGPVRRAWRGGANFSPPAAMPPGLWPGIYIVPPVTTAPDTGVVDTGAVRGHLAGLYEYSSGCDPPASPPCTINLSLPRGVERLAPPSRASAGRRHHVHVRPRAEDCTTQSSGEPARTAVYLDAGRRFIICKPRRATRATPGHQKNIIHLSFQSLRDHPYLPSPTTSGILATNCACILAIHWLSHGFVVLPPH